MPKVSLRKCGNRFIVDPSDQAVRELLEPALTFTAKEFLFGFDRKEAGRSCTTTEYACFGYDAKNRLATSWGFHKRVTALLCSRGYEVELSDLNPHPHPEIFVPQWDRLFDPKAGIELRFGQDEALVKILANPCGRLDCPPGWG